MYKFSSEEILYFYNYIFDIYKNKKFTKEKYDENIIITKENKKELEDWIKKYPFHNILKENKIKLDICTLNILNRNQKNGPFFGLFYDVVPTRIKLCVEDLSTYLHELCHAVDFIIDKDRYIKTTDDDREVIAEISSQVLQMLYAFGRDHHTKVGYSYIIGYCGRNKRKLIQKIVENKERIILVVKYIIKNGKLYKKENYG